MSKRAVHKKCFSFSPNERAKPFKVFVPQHVKNRKHYMKKIFKQNSRLYSNNLDLKADDSYFPDKFNLRTTFMLSPKHVSSRQNDFLDVICRKGKNISNDTNGRFKPANLDKQEKFLSSSFQNSNPSTTTHKGMLSW